MRLAGPLGTTPWCDAALADGRFEAVLALVTNVPWGQTRLPGGRYALEVQGPRGEAAELDWSPALLAEPPDLVDERSALRLKAGGELVVDAPLDDHQRSAFGQQALVTAYAARRGARPARPPPGGPCCWRRSTGARWPTTRRAIGRDARRP